MPSGKRLVVDASVARSAGWETAPDPHSRLCREVLETIRSAGHWVVLSPECLAEWKRHRSSYSRGWLVRMVSRRKVVFTESVRNEELRSRLGQANLRDRDRRAVDKDFHLVEAALPHDRIVLSRDEAIRQILKRVAVEIREVQAILWGNPVIQDEKVVVWLEGGAKAEQARKLGSSP